MKNTRERSRFWFIYLFVIGKNYGTKACCWNKFEGILLCVLEGRKGDDQVQIFEVFRGILVGGRE